MRIFIILLFSFLMIQAGYSQTVTNVGSDFWIAFPDNTGNVALELFISSNYATSGAVTSAYPGVDQTFTVMPGSVTKLTIPSGLQLSSYIEDKGIHVTSNDPVSLYGLNKRTGSTDAFLALPTNALGTDYRIVTYSVTAGIYGTSFSVVATQNGTILTIFNHQTGSTSNISLNQGQTYVTSHSMQGNDVTGSRIQSNFPVAVFGSVQCVNIPANCTFCDHIVEQMFPYYSWGKNFITVPLAGRDDSGDIFRIVAASDGTDISINGTNVATINAGDHYETLLTGYNAISTTKATLLAQFAKGQSCSGPNDLGDPFMMLIPPREQFLTNYTVATVQGFASHWVNVVAPGNALNAIYQDGVLIPASAFTPIGTTGFYGAQRSVAEESHTFNSSIPFGVFSYGWNPANSYGYPGGGSLSPVGTVTNVTLSPPSASGVLNVSTICFTAHVTDNFNSPVAGVLVNFNISGLSPLIGNAYTDALGDAQYCYTRTGTTPGIDNIYAECFGFTSSTSTANWTNTPPPCINPTDPGSISESQTGCGSFIPTPLTSILLPSGQTGNLEYKWQMSTTGPDAGFVDIPASNTPDFAPGTVSQTTWFKRIARVDCMPDWIGAVETGALKVTVITPVTPSLTIMVDHSQVCSGEVVMATATPVQGGNNPVYQWQLNGNPVGTNNPGYLFSPNDGDILTCLLFSSVTCTTSNPVTGNQQQISVLPMLPVGITISASANPVCEGIPVTFTAGTVNPGSNPVFQWMVNGIAAGSNSPTFIFTPENGDVITCQLIASGLCTLGNPASSNALQVSVNPAPIVTFTNCFDNLTTVNARPFKLKGGLPLGGTYSGAGVNSVTAVFTPSLAGPGIHTITYTYTNAAGCSSISHSVIQSISQSNIPCDNDLVDIRDSRSYPTVRIGSQCWMQANLDYGTAVPGSIHQTDNCIPEKYTGNSSVLYGTSSFYQWDELLRYEPDPGSQGLCPPGWHVPSESDWNVLFNYCKGQSHAGEALWDPYLNGFTAQPNGVFYQNALWSYHDFAVIFWSSTTVDATRAWSHGMNGINFSVSSYPAMKADAFPVRCLQD